MKLLVVADIHYALKQFDWLVGVAHRYDLVIIAGDLLEIASSVDRRAQIVVINTYLRKLSSMTRVIACSGNHDLDAEDENGERIAAWMADLEAVGVGVDGATHLIDGIRFSVLPWWDGAVTRGAVDKQLQADAALGHERWVWVYHAPPADSPVSWSGRRHFGDPQLVQWIEIHRPELVLSGHVHQSPFVADGSWVDRIDQTWVFNTGQQPGDVPAMIAIDMSARRAAWLSMAGGQAVELSDRAAKPQPLTAMPDWITI